MSKVRRPSCAGYYELGHVQCDGNPDLAEPACRYRERCLLLIELGGGPAHMGERDPDNNARVLEAFNDTALSDYLAQKGREKQRSTNPSRKLPARVRKIRRERERQAAERAMARLPVVDAPTPRPYDRKGGRPRAEEAAMRVGRPTCPSKQAPRPEQYSYTLPVMDALVDALAKRLQARRIPESDPRAQVGDLYAHYTRTNRGQRVIVMRCIKECGKRHHRLFSVWLLARDPWVNLTLHVESHRLLDLMNLRPPHGLQLQADKDPKYGEEIRALGVTPALVEDTATWLGRVYSAGFFLLPKWIRANAEEA